MDFRGCEKTAYYHLPPGYNHAAVRVGITYANYVLNKFYARTGQSYDYDLCASHVRTNRSKNNKRSRPRRRFFTVRFRQSSS